MKYDILKYHIVTTLPDSTSRQENITDNFKKLSKNDDFKVNFYYGWYTKNKFYIKLPITNVIYNCKHFHSYFEKCSGFLGCVQSLLGALNFVKLNNWPYAFILEDDVNIDPMINLKINKYINEDFDYKLLLLGWDIYPEPGSFTIVNNYLKRSKSARVHGGYGFLIKQENYDWLINRINGEKVSCRDVSYLNNKFLLDDGVYLLNEKLIIINSTLARQSSIQ